MLSLRGQIIGELEDLAVYSERPHVSSKLSSEKREIEEDYEFVLQELPKGLFSLENNVPIVLDENSITLLSSCLSLPVLIPSSKATDTTHICRSLFSHLLQYVWQISSTEILTDFVAKLTSTLLDAKREQLEGRNTILLDIVNMTKNLVLNLFGDCPKKEHACILLGILKGVNSARIVFSEPFFIQALNAVRPFLELKSLKKISHVFAEFSHVPKPLSRIRHHGFVWSVFLFQTISSILEFAYHFLLYSCQSNMDYLSSQEMFESLFKSPPKPAKHHGFSDFLFQAALRMTSDEILDDVMRISMYGLRHGTPEYSLFHESARLISISYSLQALIAYQNNRYIDSLRVRLVESLENTSLIVREELLPFYQSCHASLALLSLRDRRIIEEMKQYLVGPNDVFMRAPDLKIQSQLRSVAIEYLVLSLQADCIKHGDEIVISLVYSMSNMLYAISATHDVISEEYAGDVSRSHLIPIHIVEALGRMACQLQHKRVAGIVLSALIRRLGSPSSSLDKIIISQLAQMAQMGQKAIFGEIIELFSQIFKKSSPAANTHTLEAVSEAWLSVAKHLSDPVLRDRYLKHILSLFVECAPTAIGLSSVDVTSSAVTRLKVLLNAASTLLSGDSNSVLSHDKGKKEESLVFRNFWFYCVLLRFTEDPSCLPALKCISKRTPSLSGLYLLDADMAVMEDHVKTTKGLQTRLRHAWAAVFPRRVADWKSLPMSQWLYLMAVYHVETLRVAAGANSEIFSYFSEDIGAAHAMSPCLDAIADSVVSTLVKTIRDTCVEEETNREKNRFFEPVSCLMIGACHRSRRIHLTAIRMVESLIFACPAFLFDARLLFGLLNLLELLAQCCEKQFGQETSYSFSFDDTRHFWIDLPDDREYRKQLLSEMTQFTRFWLLRAMQCAPAETITLLQNYMAQCQSSNVVSMRHHAGAALAADMSFQYHPPSEAVGSMSVPLLSSKENLSVLMNHVGIRHFYSGQVDGMTAALSDSLKDQNTGMTSSEMMLLHMKQQLTRMMNESHNPNKLDAALQTAVVLLTRQQETMDRSLVSLIVSVPMTILTEGALRSAVFAWSWLVTSRPDCGAFLLAEIIQQWELHVSHKIGLFCHESNPMDVFFEKMEYGPPQNHVKSDLDHVYRRHIPHELLLHFMSDRLQVARYGREEEMVLLFLFVETAFLNQKLFSEHPMTRGIRFKLLTMALNVMKELVSLSTRGCKKYHARCDFLRCHVYQCALQYFSLDPSWMTRSQATLSRDIDLLIAFDQAVQRDKADDAKNVDVVAGDLETTFGIPREKSMSVVGHTNPQWSSLVTLFLHSEIDRLRTWQNPLSFNATKERLFSDTKFLHQVNWREMTDVAWEYSVSLSLQLYRRFHVYDVTIEQQLRQWVLKDTIRAIPFPDMLQFLLTDDNVRRDIPQLRYVHSWAPVPPVTALRYLCKGTLAHPFVLQYGVRVLNSFPADTILFYIPQIVQALRCDSLGFVESYILSAARKSQMLAHQFIWNMKANMYLDENATKPDAMKPVLDRVVEKIVVSLSGDDKAFYEREFDFFNRVTGISGKLKPFLKKSKAEKKQKIDEELSKIVVAEGVYLPSDPDCVVIGIDYQSGRPLQSHAKAPFLATFKIQPIAAPSASQAVEEMKAHSARGSLANIFLDASRRVSSPSRSATVLSSEESKDATAEVSTQHNVWRSVIFKVGDDCRQDLLALQLVATFKSIFQSAGLDLFVYPYRVIATAPGCGVIECVPHSISRDQMGREKINSLYDYFVTHYGDENSAAFQKARNNFIKSTAAYSVIIYLLAIKDRHNGNIMLDDAGHIVHIDFGFILDISPGGITFETSPFKLTTEMIQVMGGRMDSQYFRWFTELCVKCYLAARPHAEAILQMVSGMLQSGLPCFRGETTLKRMQQRFQLDKNDRAAADYMSDRVRESYGNVMTVVYDAFQKLQNGIPY